MREGWRDRGRKRKKEACEREGKGGMKEAGERWRDGGRKRKKLVREKGKEG